MTTALRTALEAKIGWTWRDTIGTSVIVDSNRLSFGRELLDGALDAQADAVWHLEGQVVARDESFLLPLDALEQSLFGDTILIPMRRIKAILIVNRNTSGSAHLVVGGAPSDPWSAPFGTLGGTIRVMPDSPLLLTHHRHDPPPRRRRRRSDVRHRHRRRVGTKRYVGQQRVGGRDQGSGIRKTREGDREC
jgi:hypothetical protein